MRIKFSLPKEMVSKIGQFALLVAVILAGAFIMAQFRVYILTPVADKGVTTGDFKGGLKPQDPDGKAPVFWVAQLVWWGVQQGLIKFDLSKLPKTMQIKKATLELYVVKFEGITAGKEPEPAK